MWTGGRGGGAGAVLNLSLPGSSAAAETVNKKISLKVMTLSNSRQKINDCLAILWRSASR